MTKYFLPKLFLHFFPQLISFLTGLFSFLFLFNFFSLFVNNLFFLSLNQMSAGGRDIFLASDI